MCQNCKEVKVVNYELSLICTSHDISTQNAVMQFYCLLNRLSTSWSSLTEWKMCVCDIIQCFVFLTYVERLLIISALSACFCIVCISSLLTAFTLSSLIVTDCVVILTFLTALIINQETAWAVNIFLTVIIVESHISFTVILQSAYILWVLTIKVMNSHTVCTLNWLTA